MEQGEIPNATGTVSVRTYLSAGHRVWTKVSHSEPGSGEGGIRTQEAKAPAAQVRRLTSSQIGTGKESRVCAVHVNNGRAGFCKEAGTFCL